MGGVGPKVRSGWVGWGGMKDRVKWWMRESSGKTLDGLFGLPASI